MDMLGAWSLNVAKELGITAVAPFVVRFDNGLSLQVSALFPQFGARNGMVLVANSETLLPYVNDLGAGGYGFSSFDGPYDRRSDDIGAVKEMLAEWGWSDRKSQTPVWLRGYLPKTEDC